MGTLKQIREIVLVTIVGLSGGYVVSEYADLHIRMEVAEKMEIDKDRIYFLYNKEDKCHKDDRLYDNHHGICIRK